MRRNLVFVNLIIVLFLWLTACTTEDYSKKKIRYEPPVTLEEATAWADSMVGLMTVEEKIDMIGGDRIFYTQTIERLGIPPVLFADATQGVHLRDNWRGGEIVYERALPKSTAFPSPILLASSWNKDLAQQYAGAIGEECRAGAIPVLLGPGMNIYRQSQCGRNFEYFGEDPYLAARMIENYVFALQSTGTIATLKHFVANNTDYYRRKSNSVVDERTLHEIYLPAFKAGIDAGAMAVMTAYNLVNGEWCGQSEYLIKDLLREQLGFSGLVMTDWWSVYDGVKTIKSGQDLEMPYRMATENAAALLKEGKVSEEEIDGMVMNILKTLYAMEAFGREKDESFNQWDAHEEIALQTAREGVILLKNDREVLPLQDPESILLTGDYYDKVAHGGGAATVEGYNHVVLEDAMKEIYNDKLTVSKSPGEEEIKNAAVVILNIGTYDSEGSDRPFDLPARIEEEILRLSNLNDNVIVVVNSGSGINMSRWQNQVSGILFAWYPGQNGALAIAEIISGRTNPSGKLPVTIEKDFGDSPAADYLPEGETLYEGWNDDVERVRDVYDLEYKEGVMVGYRWYEQQGIAPLYPFGYGLSYTTFEYADLKVSNSTFKADETIEISFSVKNTGDRAGAEVAQLYISDKECSLPRPPKELKGFEKVMLEAGETKKVRILLSKEDFSFWSPEAKGWITEPGEFDVIIGPSSAEEALKISVQLSE